MNRLANRIISAEREGDIAHPTGNHSAWKILLNPSGRFDKVDGIVVMLFDPRSDSEYVGIKDNIERIEVEGLGEQTIAALTNLNLALKGICLTVSIEGHDDDRGAIELASSCAL